MYINDANPTPHLALGISRPALTVAQAIERVSEWEDIAPRRRYETVSCLSTFARIAGIPPESLTLTVATVRRLLLNRSGAMLGVSEGRMRNIRHALRFVLCRLELIDPPCDHLMPAWEALLEAVNPRQRAALIAFARYCSRGRVNPAAVDVTTLRTFLSYLDENTATSRPQKLVSGLRTAWNQCAAQIPTWPTSKLPALHEGRSYALPISSFSTSFQQDLAAFGRRLAGNLLADDAADSDDSGPLLNQKPLRPTSVALRLSHARWAASALVASGFPIGDITSLASLVTPLERAKDILRYFYRRAGDKPSAAGMHVAEVLRIIAKYHARRPDAEVAQIRAWGRPVALTYRGMTIKNQQCVRDAMDPERERKLRALPSALMEAARRMLTTSPREAAALAWRAVAIEVLTKRPLRLNNLRNLRLDRHLHRSDPRKATITAILIDLPETKNKQSISLPLSTVTSALIDDWINTFRHLLADPDCMYLFPGRGTGNKPLTPQALRDAIKNTTRRYVGVTITPHQFRHFAAHVFLDEHPGEYELVRQLLGHASVVTTTRHYAGHQTDAAARRFDDVILKRSIRPSRKLGATGSRRKRRSRHPITSGSKKRT